MEVSEQISKLSDGANIVESFANYGFVVESVQAEALLKTFCHLTTIGDLGQRHYALAFPKGSIWTDPISKQILKYVESGTIYKLKNMWELPMNCSRDDLDSSTEPSNSLPFYGPFMMLLFAGIASLCVAFLELFIYALLRSKRATFCLPENGPTGARGGKACSILREELNLVLSRSSEEPGTRRRSRIDNVHSHGLSSPRVVNRFGQVSPRQNGDTILKTANNGDLKNGHHYYQTQALLRKDGNKDEDNAQL